MLQTATDLSAKKDRLPASMEKLGDFMTKFTECIRRRIVAIPAKMWACLVTLCCLSLTLFVLFDALYLVKVTDSNGAHRMMMTHVKDPEQLMSMSGITADEGDNVYYTAYNGNLASLNIQRAIPITVNVDGGTQVTKLVNGTVEDALESCGVELGEHDYTEPSLHTDITDAASINVHRVEYRDTVTYESIPFETEYVYTSLYYRNRRRTDVVQQGHEGTNEITTRERVVDGEVESSQVISVEQTVAPQNTIIKAYKAGAPVSQVEGPEVIDGVPSSYSAVYTGRATGYSAGRGRGASGKGLYCGTVAVNPNVIPYGTKLYITSTDGRLVYGYAIATDTGAALMDGTGLVDLFYESYEEALMNGVQQVNVYVVS